MDDFEKYIKENRLLLDTEDVDKSLLDGVNFMMKRHHRKKVFRTVYIAASILLFFSFGFFQFLRHKPNETNLVFTNFSTDVANQEIEYVQLINAKVKAVKGLNVPIEYIQRFDEFVSQLRVIDNQYEIYKNELVKSGYNDELIQQIIYNYQLKLSVLKMLQSEINKINELTNNPNHEYKKIQINI